MSGLLDRKVILVTGGANGIGFECALAYVREGASVVIADCDPSALSKTAGQIGSVALPIKCDVTDRAAVMQAVAAALDRFGRLDAVHNNAGISNPSKLLEETTEAEWDRLVSVNLKSILWTTHAALPSLKSSNGTILNTASLVGLIGQANHAAYAMTKGGMIALTKSMALDYATLGIRVNAICPAGVRTPLLEQWAREQPKPEEVDSYLDQIHALGYCPKGDVVADAAVFLLSDRARFITGCILPVSGGAELGYRR